MKLQELAQLLNKTEKEVEDMLSQQDEVVVDLRESNKRKTNDKFEMKVV